MLPRALVSEHGCQPVPLAPASNSSRHDLLRTHRAAAHTQQHMASRSSIRLRAAAADVEQQSGQQASTAAATGPGIRGDVTTLIGNTPMVSATTVTAGQAICLIDVVA